MCDLIFLLLLYGYVKSIKNNNAIKEVAFLFRYSIYKQEAGGPFKMRSHESPLRGLRGVFSAKHLNKTCTDNS